MLRCKIARHLERRVARELAPAGDFGNCEKKEHPGRNDPAVQKRNAEEAVATARDGGKARIGIDQRS